MDNNTYDFYNYKKQFTLSKEVEIVLMIIIILFFCCFSTFVMACIDEKCNKYGRRNVNKRKGLRYYLKKCKKEKYRKNDEVQPEETITI